MIDNSKNEIGGGGIERDAGGDEKELIKLVTIKLSLNGNNLYFDIRHADEIKSYQSKFISVYC